MTRSIRIASYNVHKAVGVDYRRDPNRIARIIGSLDADIVALQEVDRRMGDRPAVLTAQTILEESGLVPAQVATSAVSVGWHGNAILVRDTLRVIAVERLSLPGLEPRGAVLVEIETPMGDLTVVGAHLGLLRSFRRRQLSKIIAEIGDARHARSVILGDFNEWRRMRGLEPLMDRFQVVRPGNSFHSVAPFMNLDRIVLGGDLRLLQSGVVRTRLSTMASDHLPVFADISATPGREPV